MADSGDVQLTIDHFGEVTDANSVKHTIKRYTWSSKKLTLQVITYGATITCLKVPDKRGNVADVVMGFDTIDGYLNKANPYFGSTVGRYANRIRNAVFHLDGKMYKLAKNVGEHHLHGGLVGFDKVVWSSYVEGKSVTFSYLSPNGEEGYPGNVLAQVTYEVVDDSVKIKMTCKCTEPTPVNLTNHSYFNLSGHDAGPLQLYAHEFIINADTYTVLDKDLTATGEIKKISELGIEQDLTMPTPLHQFMPNDGFDINFCINDANNTLKLISRVSHPISGRVLEVYSNQPGVQFYTSNFLPSHKDNENGVFLNGKDDASYLRHGAFCLEPQAYPNAVNIVDFPNSILKPNDEYVHNIVFKFSVDSKSE